MDTRWLQDFLAIADTGHFTRAAAARNASQAAFSRRIQSLEAWLGVTLIDRSDFPARLTAEGERFKVYALEILEQVIAARGELSGRSARDRVRIAVPYALATANLATWWQHWSSDQHLSCSLVHGNVHDLVTSLISQNVDLLMCFHSVHRPIQLAAESYDHSVVATGKLQAYASPQLIASGGADLPGDEDRPVPLLMYSPGVYFGALVNQAIENAPDKVHGRVIMESDMSDVLCTMAVAGYGVAWLPDCTAERAPRGSLVPVGDERWTVPISIVAFRDRTNESPAARRLWNVISSLDPSRIQESAA